MARRIEEKPIVQDAPQSHGHRAGNALAFLFTLVILLYAAAAPLTDFVHWLVETGTPGFDELSRRERRALLADHWLSGGLTRLERTILMPTGMILGLPLLLSFAICFLTLPTRGPVFSAGLTLLSAGIFGYWIIQLLALDDGVLPSVRPQDYVLLPLAVALTLYLTFRLYGPYILAFALFWIAYFFLRGQLPTGFGVFAGSESGFAQSMRTILLHFWAQTGGMFGQPLQVVSGTVLIFIVFGAVLTASGAGAILLRVASRATGRLAGGAAHAAIASSALFGTVSGAAIANVVSTGAMTIPVIRKSGFRPSFAAAVEASASTGGQVMPPVMGIVAFFMAGQIGVEYRYIVVAAIVPALFFYLGLFLTVYFEARKCGVGRLKEPERAPLTRREMLQCLVFLLPLAAMSYSLFTQPSVQRAGFIGFGVAFITALMLFPGFRTPKAVAGAFIAAGKLSASIIAIVAAIGLIVGLIQLSGFSGRLSLVLTEMATGPQFTMLLVLAAGAIVLGMGLPPGATYFVIVIALSSGIDAMSLAPLTLHLFVVFFAVISTVTPPVALAAFAAAPIAGANPIRTGLEAARLSAAGFIIPFVFAYHPAVLYKLHAVFELFGSAPPSSRAMLPAQSLAWIDLVWVIAAFALAMWLIASATVGFDRRRLSSLQRLLRGAVGLMVLLPDKFLALIGAALALALLFGLPRWPRLRSPRAADKPPRGPTGRP